MLHQLQSCFKYLKAHILPQNQSIVKSSGGWYGTHDFRHRAVEGLTLHKGEVLYFEIVGWVNEGSPIMPPHPVKEELPDIKARYGDLMHYHYGQAPGTCDIYVYKIIRTNEDGVAIDLPWPSVQARCQELGLKTVPMLGGPWIHADEDGKTNDLVTTLTEGASLIDNRHIREGVVLRVESAQGVEYVKNKSLVFGFLEGYIKDLDGYVDLEETS